MFVLLAASLSARAATTASRLHPASPVLPNTLAIDGLGKGAAPLDGAWQFHLGDDPNWAAPGLDDSPANGWEQLTADQPWGMQGHANYVGYGWYRRRIHLTPAPGASPDFALIIQKVQNVYELYWNGVLIGQHGRMPPNAVWYFTESPQTFGMGLARDGVLAVRVWKSPLDSFDPGTAGGFAAVPMIGSPTAIAAAKDAIDYQWLRRRQFTFALDSFYAVITLLSLIAWLRDRSQWLVFWMGGFALAPLLNLILLGLPLGLPYSLALGLAQPVFGMIDITLWFLLVWLLQIHENQRFLRIVRIAAVIDMCATILDGALSIANWPPRWVTQVQIADGVLTAIFTVSETLPLFLVGYAVIRRRKLEPERWLVAIFALFTEMISVVRIAAQQGERFTHWTLADKIGSPLFVFNGNTITAGTISSVLLLISILYAVYRFSVENRRRQATLEQEYKNARELQQVLVPETIPALAGFALTSAYRPAQEVGGDFFQIIPLENGSTLVVLGDVSGKGLKAAMAVSLIVGATRMIVEYSSSPAEILAGLNRRLYGRMQDGFATAIALRLDPDGRCTISAAGHPSPFLNQHEIDLPGALPLGITPSATYEESTVHLRVGDHFALYTDGLLEARSRTGELYGFERLETLFATRPNAAQASQAAVNFGQDDDITVLTLTRLATGQESTSVHSVPGLVSA